MIRPICITLIILLLAAAGISCVQTGGGGPRAEISVIKKELTTGTDGKAVLVVMVKNTGRIKADLAEVAVRFYDSGKNLIDSNRDSIINLGIDETWEFRIPCDSPIGKIASYEIETTGGASGGGL